MAEDSTTPPTTTKASVAVWDNAKKGTLFNVKGDEKIKVEFGEGKGSAEKTWDEIVGHIKEQKTKLGEKGLDAKTREEIINNIKPYETAAEKLRDGVVGEARRTEFKNNVGIFKRQGAKIGANFAQASTTGKVIRGASVGLGALLVAKGIKDLVAPNRDEKGENTTGYVVPLVEVAAGAGGVYFAALHGGTNKALGMHF